MTGNRYNIAVGQINRNDSIGSRIRSGQVNNRQIVLGQINMGRKAAAWDIVGNVSVERHWGIIIIQEPYKRDTELKGYNLIRSEGGAKVVIAVKEGVGCSPKWMVNYI